MDKYLPYIKLHAVPLALGLLGLICLVYGLMSSSGSKKAENVHFQAAQSTRPSTKPLSKKITVDIAGAVVKPGVYDLASDSRLQDAIRIAGGLRPEADHLQIAQHLNLASKLTDGGKIYLPFAGEKPISATSNVLGSQSGLVNINSASASQLEDLPGIGVVTAKKIIDNRPYSSISELTQKKVVGTKVFEQIKNLITP